MIDANTSQQLDQLILVHTAGSAQTHDAIDEVIANSPVATVKTAARYTQDQADQVDVVLNLLGVSILVALVGIMNTLELSILERTREIGLRAVGMTGREVWSTIRYEAAIVALLGTTLGVALGCPPPLAREPSCRRHLPGVRDAVEVTHRHRRRRPRLRDPRRALLAPSRCSRP